MACKKVAALTLGGAQPLGEGLRERHVAGDVGTEPEALTEQDVKALLPSGRGSLSHQTGLADAGLTVQEEHARFAGYRALDHSPQSLAFRLATDQCWLDTRPMIIRQPADPRRCPRRVLS